jgi:hypothetical protein
MNIHQVCVSYNHEHDRFLVRINTRSDEEVRLWFTRRLTLGLLPLLEKASAEQRHQQATPQNHAAPMDEQRRLLLENFEQEAASYKSDFQTPYREQLTALPLGPEPLLVTDIRMTALADGGLELNMHEKRTDNTRNLNIKLDAQLTRGLVSLLNQALSTSRWLETEIGVTVKINGGKASQGLERELEPMNPALSADKPRYLN